MPSREEIKPQVIDVLQKEIDNAQIEIKEKSRLFEDLNLGELRTVGDSITLVYERSNTISKTRRKKNNINLILFLIVVIAALSSFVPFAIGRGRTNEKIQFKLSYSAIDKNQIETPAGLFYSKPTNKEPTYSINAALALKYRPIPINFVAEYHANTAIEKKQDLLKIGGSFKKIFGDYHFFFSQISFKKDKEKGTKSLEALIRYTPIILSIDKKQGFSWLEWVWRPVIGFDYENLFGAQKGVSLRGYIGLDFCLYPLGKTIFKGKYLQEFCFSYSNWRDFEKDIVQQHRNYRLFAFSALQYLDSSKNYGIGINYSDGESPLEGLEKQKFWKILVIIKFGKIS